MIPTLGSKPRRNDWTRAFRGLVWFVYTRMVRTRATTQVLESVNIQSSEVVDIASHNALDGMWMAIEAGHFHFLRRKGGTHVKPKANKAIAVFTFNHPG